MGKLSWIRFICSFFPPIVAQQIRQLFISISQAEKLALPFKRRSFTGGYLDGNTEDFHAFKFLIHGYFEWRNVVLAKKILKLKKGAILEVGANVGTETVGFTDVNPSSKVYAFEPLPRNVDYLETLKQINNYDNLYIHNVLVSDCPGEAHFNIPLKYSSGTGHITSTKSLNSESFEVVTLDKTINDSSQVSLIVVDVEGYEPNVLRGAKKIINNSKPFLILEVNARFLEERAQITIDSFYTKIINLGYTPYYIERLCLRPIDPSNFKNKSNKNWICIPQEFASSKCNLSRAIAFNAFNPLLHFFIF